MTGPHERRYVDYDAVEHLLALEMVVFLLIGSLSAAGIGSLRDTATAIEAVADGQSDGVTRHLYGMAALIRMGQEPNEISPPN